MATHKDPHLPAIRYLEGVVQEKGLRAPPIHGWYIEGRVFQRIHHNAFIIRSYEGAPVDGAILIRGSEDSSASNTDRLMRILDWEKQKKPFEVMPFDVKSAAIRCYSNSGWTQFGISIKCVAKQTANCAFFLIVLKENSKYVALLSPELIMKKEKLGKEKTLYITWQLPRQLIQWIDYFQDAIPWTFHIDELPSVLRNFRDQKRQNLALSVKGIPLMTRGKCLTSAELMAKETGELAIIKFFYNIFKQNPDLGLSLNLLDFRPLWADFWVNQKDGTRTLIELKGTIRTCLYTVEDGWLEHVSYQRGRSTSIFHSARPWDHLITYNHASDEFYALPFNIVPQNWRNDAVRAKERSSEIEWVKAPQTQFEPFRLRLRDPDWLRKFVNILQMRRSPPNQYDCSALYTTGLGEAGEVDELQDLVEDVDTLEANEEEEILDEDEEEIAINEDPSSDQVSGSRLHGSGFQKEVMERLMHDCAMSMKGLYFCLGRKHPIADFVFVQYEWTRKEQQAYVSCRKLPLHIAELTDMTRVVLLSAHQETYAQSSIGGLTNYSQYFYRHFRQVPSIMVMATSKTFRNHSHDEPVYLLPSCELLPPTSWKPNDLNEFQCHHNRWLVKTKGFDNLRINLRTGMPLTHSVRLSEVHLKMRQIIGENNFQVGIDPTQVYNSKPYVLQWKKVKLLHANALYARLNAPKGT